MILFFAKRKAEVLRGVEEGEGKRAIAIEHHEAAAEGKAEGGRKNK